MTRQFPGTDVLIEVALQLLHSFEAVWISEVNINVYCLLVPGS